MIKDEFQSLAMKPERQTTFKCAEMWAKCAIYLTDRIKASLPTLL